jgi:hypothetical protein
LAITSADYQSRRMDRPEAPVRAQVTAAALLIRVGLEQAALAAGLQLSGTEGSAAIGLRTPDTGPTDATLDVRVEANLVRISLTALPDQRTWTALLALLGQLLDTVADPT